jgi:succinyl-CoA synthetase alpha subunit
MMRAERQYGDMAILIDESSRVIIQGITGRIGKIFSDRMAKHYSTFCGGVKPGFRGSMADRSIFPSVAAAVAETGANASIVVVPATAVKEAVLEAIEAGIRLVWVYADGVPVHDSLYFINYARIKGTRIIGPNSAGIVSPGKASCSELHEDVLPLRPGRIGILSKSGSISYEVIDILSSYNYGFSSVLCIGGDPVCGTSLADGLSLFAADRQTDVIVLLGEIGGTAEIEAARVIPSVGKPVVAYVTGWHAPAEKTMGHAGAVIHGDKDTATAKSAILAQYGARVATSLESIGRLVDQADHDRANRSAAQGNC